MTIEDASTPVVVLNANDHGSLGIARTLGRWGVAVHGINGRTSPVARSRYWRSMERWDPKRGDEHMLEVLDRVHERIGHPRPVLIPTGDDGVLFVERHGDLLRERFRFPDQPPGLVAAVSSKRGMDELCRRHGVPTPGVAFPEQRSEVESFASAASFPQVLKAIDGSVADARGTDRTVIARSAAELLTAYDRVAVPGAPNELVQQHVPGGPDSVWMFNGYVGRDGRCHLSVTARKLRQAPPETGVTCLGKVEHNPTVDEQTRTFIAAVGYRGILDCDYLFDARDGEYKLLDVNPRVGQTFRLFAGTNDLDVVRALYLDLTGQIVPAAHPIEGRRWVVENGDAVSSLQMLRSGDLRPAAWARSYRGVQEAAWWARDDPRPFVAMLGESLGRAGRAARAVTTRRSR